jgi:hypothetical protein
MKIKGIIPKKKLSNCKSIVSSVDKELTHALQEREFNLYLRYKNFVRE